MKQTNVLCVDDEENILKTLKRTLHKEKYNLYFATSGKKALEICQNNQIHLIICDYKMPEMTGCQVLSIIKNKYPNIIRIILSGYSDIEFIMSAINEGSVHKYLLKPWDNNDLRNIIKTLLLEQNNKAILDNKDPVTGLIGLKQLKNKISDELINNSEIKNFYIVMVSIPNLNQIIDYRSINTGRQLLQSLSSFLKKLNKNIINARLNSHTFILVYPNATIYDITKLENNINLFVQELNIKDQYDFLFKVNYGVSCYPKDSTNIEEVINKAEELINIKNSQKPKIFSNQKLCINYNNDTKICYESMVLEKELFKAINSDDIYICVQPIYSQYQDIILAAEVLARWRHNGINIPPDVFIPLSIESGTSTLITKIIFEKSCIELKKINSIYNSNFKLSINIPPYLLVDDIFINNIYNTIEKYKINYKNIQIEITEDAFLELNNKNMTMLEDMRNKGILIAIDDFGTGYASFGYLKKIHVDIIKIDQMFIRDITTNKNSYNIVEAMINMAHSLNIKVVAEGIENSEQLEILKTLNCDYIQGYYISKPMNLDKFYEYINNNKINKFNK